MLLRKIVDWISDNPQLEPPVKSINEIIMEVPEDATSEIAEVNEMDDNCNSTNAGCVLEENFIEQNGVVEFQQYDKEKVKNAFNDDNSLELSTTSKNIERNIEIVANDTKLNCDRFVQKELQMIRSRSSTSNFARNSAEIQRPIDIDNVIKKDSRGLVIKLNSAASNSKPQPLLCKNLSGFNRCTTPVNNFSKRVFTETGIGANKLCANVLRENSNKYIANDILENREKSQLFPVCESSLAHYTKKYGKSESFESSLYGILFVVGCSKVVPTHLTEKIKTNYFLCKRIKANGLREAFSYVTSNVMESISASPNNHVISYPSDNDLSVVVVFKHNSLSDSFQIGRQDKFPIDFKVDDINPLDKARHGVSRFACRINVRRDGNHEARIYAGAFNSSQAIFLGESGVAFDYCGKMDGFTTNGVLILKPNDSGEYTWREVSVSGYVYPLRSSSKLDISKRPRIPEETNILVDGTLIDLCGVTLIWRTPEGLNETPSEFYLNRLQSICHKAVPECSLLSQHSSILLSPAQQTVKKAYVYLSCGHVVGLLLPQPFDDSSKGWSCPVCRAIGPIKEFTVGAEPGFYFDRKIPSYAFKPCGHVASQKTVEFWSSVKIPYHRKIECSLCPFCGQKLNFITKFVKLILPII